MGCCSLSPERVPLSDFEPALRIVYGDRPCEVLPNALWKTLREIREASEPVLEMAIDPGSGYVVWLTATDDRRLMVHWHYEEAESSPAFPELAGFQLLLLHDRDVSTAQLEYLAPPERYFRLFHSGADPIRSLPDGFSLRQADSADGVAGFVNRCYEWTSLTDAIVESWTRHPVYAPDLWLWVIDRRTGAPAALGIAEFDETVPEASLEWVQVLPAYRRRGLGAALVCELLRRVEGRADFTTVAGQIDNESHPEALYRRCGFEGHDVWWVFRRDDASG